MCTETSRDLVTCHKANKANTFKSMIMCFYALSIYLL